MKSEALDIRFLFEVNRGLASVYAGLLLGGVATGSLALWLVCWQAGGFVWFSIAAWFVGALFGLAGLRATVVRRAALDRAAQLGRWCVREGVSVSAAADAAQAEQLQFVSDLTVRYRAAIEATIDAALDSGDGSHEAGGS